MNTSLPVTILPPVLAELGTSLEGVRTIVRLRQVSKTLKKQIDQIVESNQIFRSSLHLRPIDAKCLKQERALARLNDLFFGS